MVYLNGEKMMNGCNTTSTAAQEPPAVCLNWSASSPSINMSFAALSAPNTQKQLWEFETLTGVNNHHNSSTNFILPASNGFLDFSTSLIPSPFGTQNSFSQIPSDQFHQNGFLKREEEYCYGSTTLDPGSCYSSAARIGLNLGHRTYFSSRDTAVIDRLFKRSRVFYQGSQVPRCQAEGCKADLTNAKHYHRRHKVCEFHSKATKVIAGGLEQRFCQQCSRFHVLAEFDEAKRSCRKRLADHNRRRRKPQHPAKTAEKDVKGCNDKSLSSTLPLLTAKGSEGGCRREQSETQHQQQQIKTGVEEEQSRKGVVAGEGLSLGGFVQNGRRSSFPSPPSSFLGRERSDQTNVSLSPAGCPLLSSCFHDQAQHQAEDLQNLFHLGKTMFEVEML